MLFLSEILVVGTPKKSGIGCVKENKRALNWRIPGAFLISVCSDRGGAGVLARWRGGRWETNMCRIHCFYFLWLKL